MALMVDSDGVFAHFDRHVFNHTGKWPHEMSDGEMWARIHKIERYWEDMPLMDDAYELWEVVKPLNPIVLTGCHRVNFDAAAQAKRDWWKKHFDHEDVITCLSKDKALHMKAPGDILIDDMVKNIKRWEDASGVGILHRSAKQTIERLREIGLV